MHEQSGRLQMVFLILCEGLIFSLYTVWILLAKLWSYEGSLTSLLNIYINDIFSETYIKVLFLFMLSSLEFPTGAHYERNSDIIF